MIEVLNAQTQQEKPIKIRSGMKEFYNLRNKDIHFQNNARLKETLQIKYKYGSCSYLNISPCSILVRNKMDGIEKVVTSNTAIENIIFSMRDIYCGGYTKLCNFDEKGQNQIMNIKTTNILFYDDNGNYCIVDTKKLQTHMKIIKDDTLDFNLSDETLDNGESKAIKVWNNNNEYFILLTWRVFNDKKPHKKGLVLDDFKNDNTTIIHVK